MTHPRWLACLLALILPIATAGCLDYREHLTLRKDGSGILKIDFVVDLGLMGEISKALGEKPDPEAMQGPTKAEILQGLEVKGIKVKELKIKTKKSKSKVKLVIAFKNLRALSQIEGFGDDRRIDFYDKGDGRAWVVYSFDTTDVIPIEEFTDGDAPKPGEKMDPIEKKIVEITQKAKNRLRFRSRVTLPGKVYKSNGRVDPKKKLENERVWLIDKKRDPKRHAKLGKGKIRMRLLVAKKSLPFVKHYKPMPKAYRKKKKTSGATTKKKAKGGLGD